MQVEKFSIPQSHSTFKAGKVRVFSDFDKTFLPSTHDEFVRRFDNEFVDLIRNNFKNFKEFLDKTREGLKFTITTGRTFGEFLTMAEVAKERKFGMPLPDTLIVKNGSDEHTRVGTDEAFYNGGEFPFKYEVTNKEKEENIKKLTNWDGPMIKEKIKELFKTYNFRIVEGDSEHSPGDYGDKSLFGNGKLYYETGKIFEGTNKSDWSVGFRNDGNCKIFFTYPYDIYNDEERYEAVDNLNSQVHKIFEDYNIKYSHASSPGEYENECGGRPWNIYEPDILDGYFRGRHDYGLSKLYDVDEAFKIAEKNNDLVIAAGDSSNDASMLNPGSYLKNYLTEDILNRHDNIQLLYILSNRPKSLIKVLDKDPKLAEIFIKMPFRGIIVRQHDGENKLSALEPFTKGKYQKIIVVDEGELQSGIKESIKMYCEQNPKYKEKLSSDLKKQIDPDAPPYGDCPGGRNP